ncbi:hypothetical protein NGM10_13225 [Halorussus salilacus]|uniref:hypothetical protein n=1 Tax=Halorussus salilacus TaxID=2953750 RepID=UPI0020A1858C|nr:hypothetical protein [Halorussus salilacus]USZ67683.1 hypothetical protein NGM10_13225 [Halorussus salilacus]
MTSPENRGEFAASDRDSRTPVLYAVAATVVALNSALYFFGAEALSHPAVSALGLALLVPLYLRDD